MFDVFIIGASFGGCVGIGLVVGYHLYDWLAPKHWAR